MTRLTNYEELPQREKIVRTTRGAKRPPAGTDDYERDTKRSKKGVDRSSKMRYYDDFAE